MIYYISLRNLLTHCILNPLCQEFMNKTLNIFVTIVTFSNLLLTDDSEVQVTEILINRITLQLSQISEQAMSG